MNELKIVQEQEVLGKSFRVYGDFENPLFLAKDVAEWIEHSNPRVMLQTVDENEKAVNNVYTPGGNQEAWFLTEDGLYEILMQSRKPIAKKFKHEVKEILKEIRKKGIYATDTVINQILGNPEFGIKLLSELKEERENKQRLETENLQQKQIIGELKPKADYTDKILQSKDLVTITQIAKDYGMSGKEMNQKLHTLKIQYKQNNQWLLYSNYQAKGYTHSETIRFYHKDGMPDTKMVTKWTQKGRLFLYEKLKKDGILPMIEKDVVA